MKAFEEWIKTKELGIYIQNPSDRFYVELKYKQGWEAALRWVLNEGINDWTEDIIKEELND